MNDPQPDLFSIRPLSVQEIAKAHGDKLSVEFLEWLPKNMHIWNAFVSETMKVLQKGFRHYSSRTIIEFLRHHSALREESGAGWKINDHMNPYLPRLFDMVYPEHLGLWEFRITKKEKGIPCA